MKNINELVSDDNKYKKAVVHQEFKSKKNTVAYVTLKNKPRVLKWFVPGFKRQMHIEYNVIKKGSSYLNIPHLYNKDDKNNVLVIGYIIGENLCDVVNDDKTSFDEKKRLMVLLADWYAKFHNFYKTEDEFRIHGDSILRNFILSDRIWGVDFEESRMGKPAEDIAGMCSSILSTDPMFTSEKFKLCKVFMDSYKKSVDWNIGNMNAEISYALLEKIQWRPEDEEILRKHSKQIRERGLIR
jgi:tRNA A-37 threonylcarbamoyl transferase component Bud32